MEYKIIHESHARYLTDSEYRVLLSINMFQSVGKELISIEMIAKDGLMDDNTVKRSLFSLGEKDKLEWSHEVVPGDKNNQTWNIYSISNQIRVPHNNWSSKRDLIDTRSFNGSPAWACWFLATMNSMLGFEDQPGRKNFTSIADYCELDKRTVKKYYEILSKNKSRKEWGPLDNSFVVHEKLMFKNRQNQLRITDMCVIPERKQWFLQQ